MPDTRPMTLPVFPLRTVLYPGGPLPLRIFETRYVDMVGRCLKEKTGFIVSALRSGEETGPATFHSIGTFARIHDFESLPSGLLGIHALGEQRARLSEMTRQADGLNVAQVEWLAPESSVAVPAEYHDLVELLEKLQAQLPDEYRVQSDAEVDASWIGYRLAEMLPVGLEQKQYMLEMNDPVQRLGIVRTLAVSLGLIAGDESIN